MVKYIRMKPNIWHNFSIEKTLETLNSGIHGLKSVEVEERRKKYGLNILPQAQKKRFWQIFFNQIKNPFFYILFFAGILSLLLKDFVDFGVIFVVLLITVFVSFIQEYKADKSFWKLRKYIKQKAIVIRGGIKKKINSENIVLGDIIFLQAGDRVPADARLIETKYLFANESLLTGESMPIEKNTDVLDKGEFLADRKNMVYLGTNISQGRGLAVVTETGSKTEFGKIALSLETTEEQKTPLQNKIIVLSKKIGYITLAVCGLIFIIGILSGKNFWEMLLTSVALVVAAIPEGLPAAVTIILAIGARKIYQKKGLIKNIMAAETLGSATVICTDKTGTLTLGKLRIDKIITFSREYIEQKVRLKELTSKIGKNHLAQMHLDTLKTALLASDASIQNPKQKLQSWKVLGDPIDKAVFIASRELGIHKKDVEKEMIKLDDLPFSEELKYTASANRYDEERNIINFKGAPEVVLSMCSFVKVEMGKERLDLEKINKINAEFENLTSKGLRVIAVAYKKYKKTDKSFRNKPLEKVNKDLTFLGFIAFADPLRDDARNSVKVARKAGIRTVIITGDHRLTSMAIANELGIKVRHRNVLEGKELDTMDDLRLSSVIKHINLFARVEPRHKIRIVKCLQKSGEVVAMSGDGVNDAPAIKAADIGIALEDGADITKETADIILLDNNFAVIDEAIERGRVIFDNIRKVTLYLLTDSFSEILLISFSLLLGMPLPILPAQILWINLLEDGFPSIALAYEPGEKEVMSEKPKKSTEQIFNYEMKTMFVLIGIIINVFLFGVLYFFWKISHNIDYIRTLIFVILSLDSLIYVFSLKSLRNSIFHNPFSNKLLVFSTLFGFGMLLLGIYLPFLQKFLHLQALSFNDWVLPVELVLLKVGLIELIKYIFIIRLRKKTKEIIKQENYAKEFAIKRG